MAIFDNPLLSSVCNALTLTDTSMKLAKSVSNTKYLFNSLRPSLKIAVFGSSGSGKSSFLSNIYGRPYDGESTQFTKIISYQLPNGRRIKFYDCPGQKSYVNERQKIKKQIMNGKYHAIINVVCYGYNITGSAKVKVIGPDGLVRPQFLEDNKRVELDQLKEWIGDINTDTKIKWILTLVNKIDLWKDIEEDVKEYYSNSEYSRQFDGLNRFCKIHTNYYCSIIDGFADMAIQLKITEKDKYKLHEDLIFNIENFINTSV